MRCEKKFIRDKLWEEEGIFTTPKGLQNLAQSQRPADNNSVRSALVLLKNEYGADVVAKKYPTDDNTGKKKLEYIFFQPQK